MNGRATGRLLRTPRADFTQVGADTVGERITRSAVHTTPRLPYIAHQHAGQQVIDYARPFGEREADDCHDYAANDLIGIFGGGRRRVGQDDKREIERRFQIRRPVYLGNPARIADK